MNGYTPGYLKLLKTGELHEKADALMTLLRNCTLCPRDCRVDRTAGRLGYCRSGYLPIISSYCAHHGEEPVLSGRKGSGTIFFGNCNLRCVFCQNHQISQPACSLKEKEVGFETLADMMLELQSLGCHNINFVSPSHFAAQIVRAVDIAASKGLMIPLVYNTNGYDSLDTLRLLEGIIDIYLPDIKYSDDNAALEYSKVGDYVEHSRAAILEMKRQVGDLVIDSEGIAQRGLIVRHLVLPNDLAGSRESLRFISEKVGKETYISVMSQYFPTHKAAEYPLISRPISFSEYEKALEWLDSFGLENGWMQEHSSRDFYQPDFDKDKPFGGD
ncbi:MAG: Radical SAM domain protein [Deltaproteobacteria bacterium]|nr:Radical SAM domain protein [Deltaproteobacteria bacterium]